jgi:hypothetical protein
VRGKGASLVNFKATGVYDGMDESFIVSSSADMHATHLLITPSAVHQQWVGDRPDGQQTEEDAIDYAAGSGQGSDHNTRPTSQGDDRCGEVTTLLMNSMLPRENIGSMLAEGSSTGMSSVTGTVTGGLPSGAGGEELTVDVSRDSKNMLTMLHWSVSEDGHPLETDSQQSRSTPRASPPI